MNSTLKIGMAILGTLVVTSAMGQTQTSRTLYATTQDNRLATINTATSSSRVTMFNGLSQGETIGQTHS
jgi:hypothetical protein